MLYETDLLAALDLQRVMGRQVKWLENYGNTFSQNTQRSVPLRLPPLSTGTL